MKKIAFFSKNLEIGGMEKSLVVLLNELSKKYIVYLYLEEKKGVLLDYINNNIIVKEYRISNCNYIVVRKFYNYFKRFFWKIFRRNFFDFSCSFATYSIPCSKLLLIASRNNCLYVHSDYYNYYEKNINKMKNFFDSINVSKFKSVIFVSNESRYNFCKVYTNVNTTVISNLVDYANIIKLSQEKVDLKFEPNKINILYVGRLDNSSKNFQFLLEAFKKANNKSLMLYIIGNGPYKSNIKTYINDNHLNENIKLLGEMVNPYPYIKNTDYLILTSKYEGYPVIYNEALVLNKQFITTISVSDHEIDVANFFIIIKTKDELISLFKNLDKCSINYKIDFEIVNKNRINRLIDIIEERQKND